jgi:serine/threonine protein kinase
MPAEPSAKGTRRSLRIGPYAVQAPLNLGGLGSGYRAGDADGASVALKVLPAELTGSIAARDRFQREAQRAKKVRSANVVRVLEFGEASGTWYLAMELAEGETLAEFVKRKGTLTGDVVREVVVQAARALSLLQREGLVPRDLSPENFRVARGPDAKGRVGVKLLDIGLLRPANDDAPGDVRAALAGLGATAAYLLSGRSGGKLDLATLGGDVADDLRGVLRRLLATRQEERYQTPTALLDALGEEEEPERPGEDEDDEPAAAAAAAFMAPDDNPLAAFSEELQEEAPPPPTVAPKKPTRRRGEDPEPEEDEEPPAPPPPPPARGRRGADGAAPAPRRPAAGSRKALVWGAVAFGGVLLIGAAVIAVIAMSSDKDSDDGSKEVSRSSKKGVPPAPQVPADTAKPKLTEPQKPIEKPKEPDKPAPPPRLYEPKLDVAWAKVQKDFLGPWSAGGPQPPADAPVFSVSRVPAADAKPGTAFDSLAAACSAIPEGKWGVIEVADNGPLFEGPVTVSGRSVLIRGARGFSPLIVWDPTLTRAELRQGKPSGAPAKDKDEVPTFLTVEKGSLLLGGVNLAVDWPEQVSGTGRLVRVAGGDFSAWQSTFSVAGKPHATFTGVRFEGEPGKRCGLALCYARGARLTALDVAAPGADVVIDRSLLVGGEPPVLAVTAGKGDADATTVRAVRSTLLGRETGVQVRAADGADEPALHWLGYDVLLWRAGDGAGGTMMDLPAGAGAKGMTWRAVNSLYAGWQMLRSGREPLPGSDIDKWRGAWQLFEGDDSRPQAFKAAAPIDPAEALPWVYNTFPGPTGFASFVSQGYLGCDLWELPWVRYRWLDLSTQRTRIRDIEALAPDAIQRIPDVKDGLFHGERLDLDKIDLGSYLRKQKLAPFVVLHLHGTGKRKMSPVRLVNTSLFLYFEPPAMGAEPLVLEPDPNVIPDAGALFDITGGNLWMIGGDIRAPDFKTALLPNYLVMVKGGGLFLTATRLQGPMTQPPESYWGLVRIDGTGQLERGKTWTLSVNRSVLLSGRVALHLAAAGIRADLRDSLIVSTDRAVEFQVGQPQKPVPSVPTTSGAEKLGLYGAASLNMELTADHCTFAAREAAFFVDDVPVRSNAPPYFWPAIAEPIVVHPKDCAFLNPFGDKEGKGAPAALLAYSQVAVPRGMLCWQGDGNVYDKRLHAYVEATGPDFKLVPLEKAQSHAAWERLWGPGDVKPVLDWPLKATLDLEKLRLEELALPAHAGIKEKPGADIARLVAPRKGK